MNIFCIGQAAYDITVSLEGELVENRKYRVTEPKECGGGPAFNAACLCALWGARTYLISKIGTDKYGETLKEILFDFGVEQTYLIQKKEIMTPYSFIITRSDNGSRTIFNFPGKKLDITHKKPCEEIDIILSDGHEPEITLQLIKENPKAISIVDAGSFRESTCTVARGVDYLICSEDFARQYTKKNINLKDREEVKEIFEQIENINHKYVVITLGERGLLYRSEKGEVCHLPAYPVNAIDTSGAGDIFHGAFAYGMSKNLSLVENLKQSSMASAISVQRKGSQTSIPTFEEVKELLSAKGGVYNELCKND